MKRGLNSRGQMKLSFGMIFSIILIISFLAFAFIAIKFILNFFDQGTIGKFSDDFQKDVDKIWKGTSTVSQKFEYALPKKIEAVCFADFSIESDGQFEDLTLDLRRAYSGNENLFFYPFGSGDGLDSFEIEHLNLEDIVGRDNPNCFDNINGKVSFVFEKKYRENQVIVTD